MDGHAFLAFSRMRKQQALADRETEHLITQYPAVQQQQQQRVHGKGKSINNFLINLCTTMTDGTPQYRGYACHDRMPPQTTCRHRMPSPHAITDHMPSPQAITDHMPSPHAITDHMPSPHAIIDHMHHWLHKLLAACIK
eukprot:1161432-Pelagomonas_calceolata.AAC.5